MNFLRFIIAKLITGEPDTVTLLDRVRGEITNRSASSQLIIVIYIFFITLMTVLYKDKFCRYVIF